MQFNVDSLHGCNFFISELLCDQRHVSLCTDVPIPSGKIGRGDSSPDFSWGSGDVCTQATARRLKKAVIGAINKRDIIVLLYFQLVVLSFPYGGSTT